MNHGNCCPPPCLVLGGRGSSLSQAQLQEVTKQLIQLQPQLQITQRTIHTTGDRLQHLPLPQIGQKGMFTDRLARALQLGDIDAAVHSYKDMALAPNAALPIAAVLPRVHAADALVSRHQLPLQRLPAGSCVGTSSPRRAALLLHARPDLRVADVRGNLDTRMAKLDSSNTQFDAIIVAYCGLQRLGLSQRATEIFDPTSWPPAPAQGALALQCCQQPQLLQLLHNLHHPITHLETLAERAFLAALGGGCGLPIGAYGHYSDGYLTLHASVLSANGSQRIDLRAQSACVADNTQQSQHVAQQLGDHLGQQAKKQGAQNLIDPR
ncbi:MAG: hydroxymethylbilane synthase [Myxococcota bacterium]